MRMYVRFIFLVLSFHLITVPIAAYAAGKKGSAVEGKVFDVQGKPLANKKVIASQDQPLKGYERIEAKIKYDGTFILKGLYPNAFYNLSFSGNPCKASIQNIVSAPAGETKIIRDNIVLTYSFLNKGSDNIVTDQRTRLQWVGGPGRINWNDASLYAQNLSLAGGGWRLPSKAELTELNLSGRQGCGVNPNFSGYYGWVWSSDSTNESEAVAFKLDSSNDWAYLVNRTFSWGGYFDYSTGIGVLAVRSRR